jgi:hypothetical protein
MKKQLMVEVPANLFGPNVSYLGEHLARHLGRDKIRGTVWLNMGPIDVSDPEIAHKITDWDGFRQHMRLNLGVTVHDFRLDPVPD